MKNSPKALTPKDAIEIYPALGCVGSLANMRCQKRGPKYYTINRKIVYRPEDIEAFLFQSPVLTADCVEVSK